MGFSPGPLLLYCQQAKSPARLCPTRGQAHRSMTLHVALTHRTLYRYDRPLAARTAGRAPAPGPALPHADPQLFAARRARPHFINWQQDPFGNFLARVVVPDETRELRRHGRSRRRHGADQSVRLLRRGGRRQLAVRLPRARSPPSSRPISSRRPREPLLDTLPRRARRAGQGDHRLRHRPQPQAQPATSTTARAWSPACRRREETLTDALGLLPRLRLAAGADAAPHRPRRALRLRLPDPAAPRSMRLRRRRARGLHRPARLGRGLHPRRRLDRARSRPPACSPAKATSRSPRRPARSAPRPSPARTARREVDFSFAMHVARIVETPRAAKPYSDAHWQAILAAGDAWTSASTAGDVRLSMGGEPTFVAARRLRRRRMEHRRARPHQARLRRQARAPPARALRPGRPAALRPGQVVSGRAAAALGLRHLLAHATASRCGSDPSLIAGESARDLPATGDAEQLSPARSARSSACRRQRHPRLRGPRRTSCSSSRSCRSASRPRDDKLAEPAERERIMRAFERGLDKPVGYVLPLLVTHDAGGRAPLVTERWAFRRGNCSCIPGASPVGLRLPLAGLPEIDFVDYPHVLPPDPFADRRTLPEPARGAPLHQRPAPRAAPASSTDTLRLRAHRAGHRAARRAPLRVPAAARRRRGLRGAHRRHRGSRRRHRPARAPRRLRAAVRPAHQRHQGHARPRRHRGQHPPGSDLGRTPSPSPRPSTRKRQQIGLGADKFMLDGRHTGTGGGNHIVARRHHAGRQPVPAAPRPARQHHRLLAEPSLAVLPVLGPVHRPDQPGAARRRGAARIRSTSWRSRCGRSPSPGRRHRRPGWSTACSATCWST